MVRFAVDWVSSGQGEKSSPSSQQATILTVTAPRGQHHPHTQPERLMR